MILANGFKVPTPVLIDRRNWEQYRDVLIGEVKAATDVLGLDIETKDDRRHEGFNRFMKVNAEGHRSTSKKLVFDTNRTDITGFSIYLNNHDEVYYFNLMHADVENRLRWDEVYPIILAKPKHLPWIAHNAPYEITMFRKCLAYAIPEGEIICSMQLAVSLFNEDTYSPDEFMAPGLGEIKRLFPAIIKQFLTYDPGISRVLTKEQDELFYKVVAKESKAEHSYVGFIKTLTFGYGLKGLSKRFLGYTQMTFDEVMNGKPHMGCLTGDEVAAYGADDAWCCVKVYEALLARMIQENPAVVPTFFEQENPMIHIYSDVWANGVRINLESVKFYQGEERGKVAVTLRTMKAAVRALLPFPEALHDKLTKYDPKVNTAKYRGLITAWAQMPDSADDFTQLHQVRSSLSAEWSAAKGLPESKGLNITHYMPMRTMLYDLCGCSFQLHEGKVQSDAEARDVMLERWIKKHVEEGVCVVDTKDDSIHRVEGIYDTTWDAFNNVHTVLTCYKQLAESEQVIKLYINSYLNITDPETGRVYPTLNSLLNSRRMALATPNLSQLPKFGGSAYVRSFFLPDEPWELGTDGLWHMATPSAAPPKPCEPGYEQVLLSADFSGIELVLIGDASGDPTFAKAYAQLPHGDLHTGTAADLLDVPEADFKVHYGPKAKQIRNEVGKPANFEYWYSGALSKTAKAQGWGSDKMWEATERYRNRYPVGEQWRQQIIQRAREFGYVTLPDHHTRIRFESTYVWANAMRNKFASFGHNALIQFGELVIKKIQSRSGNQAVNSMIQGTCATLTKRAVVAMDRIIKAKRYNSSFKFPVHDEVVYSTQVNQLWAFMKDLWTCMCDHPDIMKTLKLDSSMAIGLNYQAYHPKTNPKGQIELSELSKLDFIPEDRWGKQATEEEVMMICDYLFDRLKVQSKEEVAA